MSFNTLNKLIKLSAAIQDNQCECAIKFMNGYRHLRLNLFVLIRSKFAGKLDRILFQVNSAFVIINPRAYINYAYLSNVFKTILK